MQGTCWWARVVAAAVVSDLAAPPAANAAVHAAIITLAVATTLGWWRWSRHGCRVGAGSGIGIDRTARVVRAGATDPPSSIERRETP